jgi:transketolase
MAEMGAGVPLVRIGIPDTFAHGATAEYLMDKFGLTAQRIIERVANKLGRVVDIPSDLAAIDVTVDVGVEQLEAL